MTRKFKTEPASYESLISVLERVQCEMPVTGEGQHKRAERLLTNWALWGHNPARNVTTCRVCGGKGGHRGWHGGPSGRVYTLIPCPSCKGTGKAVKL